MMTREEAIDLLDDIKFTSSDYPRDVEALQMAINALEREQQLLDYPNITTDFYICGRLFRVKEVTQ